MRMLRPLDRLMAHTGAAWPALVRAVTGGGLYSGRQVWAARFRLRAPEVWLPATLAVGLGVATAYLVVAGNWHIALGLIFLLPAVILLHKYPLLALFVWFALAPFLMTTQTMTERMVYWVIHRSLPPAAVGIILLSYMLKINKRPLPRPGLAELAMAGYLALSFVSILLYNDSQQATAYRLYDRVFSPMCLYVLIRLSAPTEKDLRRLLPIACFVGVSQSIIGILSWVMPHILPAEWLEKLGQRTVGSLVNTSTYTATLIFCALLMLYAALQRKPGLVRTVYLVSFVLALLCVFLSFSRASWIGGVLVLVGLILLYPKFMGRLSLVIAPAVVIVSGALLTDQLHLASKRLYSQEAMGSALDRVPVFVAAYRMFEEKPVFGWGYGNFDRYDRRFQGAVLSLPHDNKDHASHNVYLTLVAEQGLVGISLFLAPMFWWLIRTLKRRQSIPAEGFWSKKLLVMFWLAILNLIVVNNFSNALVVFGHGVWWITLGLIASMVCAVPGDRTRKNLWGVHERTT